MLIISSLLMTVTPISDRINLFLSLHELSISIVLKTLLKITYQKMKDYIILNSHLVKLKKIFFLV